MASVNKVILVGNLGRDPELRYTTGGTAVADFTLATNDMWTDKAGERQERTEWHRIVVWAKLAEQCRDYLAKGRKIYLEGRLQTRQWDDRDGNKRSTTEIVAQNIIFLDRREGGSGPSPSTGGGGSQRPSGSSASNSDRSSSDTSSHDTSDGPPPHDDDSLTDDDIPF